MKKKILIGVSLGLVLALVITTIVLALVKKSYKPEIELAPKTVCITEVDSGKEYNTGEAFSTKTKFEKVVELYNNGFEQSVLSSMFTGNLSNKIEIELVSQLPTFSEGYKLEFGYKADMVLKNDGKDFVYGTDTTKQIKFQTVIVNITEEEGYNELSMFAKEIVGEKIYYYEIQTLADTQELFDYLSELNFN